MIDEKLYRIIDAIDQSDLPEEDKVLLYVIILDALTELVRPVITKYLNQEEMEKLKSLEGKDAVFKYGEFIIQVLNNPEARDETHKTLDTFLVHINTVLSQNGISMPAKEESV